jgi:hypothetical protein
LKLVKGEEFGFTTESAAFANGKEFGMPIGRLDTFFLVDERIPKLLQCLNFFLHGHSLNFGCFEHEIKI